MCLKRKLLFVFVCWAMAAISWCQGAKPLTLKKLPVTDTTSGNKFALIIGVSSYEDKKLEKLSFAHTDALNFKNFLLQGYAGNIENPDTDIRFLVEQTAVYDSITSAIAKWLMRLRKRVKSGDAIYIYYSGHGVVSPEGQNLLPIDSRIADESLAELENNVALATIRTMVAPLVTQERGVKVYYVIDACRKNEGGGELNTANKIASEFPAPGEYFFYAASEDQYSFETKELGTGNGVYTYFLLLGLRGAADRYPADNKVSIEELEDFVQENVKDFTRNVLKGTPQKPVFKNVRDNDRQRILSVIPADTVMKYKKTFAELEKRLASRSFREELLRAENFGGLLAAKGLGVPRYTAETSLIVRNISEPKPKDSVNHPVFARFLEAVNRKQLIEPKGQSAFDYYRQLEKEDAAGELTIAANEKLFSALVSKTQKLIDKYIFGKLEDRTRRAFELAYLELLTAKNLMEEDNPYRKVLDPKIYFLHARALAGSTNPRDWDRGLQIIDSALSAAPKAAYSYYTKGILFVSKHRFFTAIRHFTRATELAPGWIYAQHTLAKTYFDVAEYDKSIHLSKQVIAKDPGYADAYSLLALNYEHVKMYDSAVYWNKKALSIDSANTAAYAGLARIYLAWQENRALAKEYLYSAAHGLHDVDAMANIGEDFLRLGQFDSAKHYFRTALSIDPFHHTSLGRYATLFAASGNTAAADSVYRDAISRMGKDSRIYAQYLGYKFSQRQYAAADSLFNLLVAFNHEDPSIFINYSGLLEKRGDLSLARNVLHNGLYYVKNSPSTIYSLANLYYKHHKNPAFAAYGLDSSLHYFRRSREITPGYSFTHFGLYQVNFEKGDIDSAFRSLETARSINKYLQAITSYNPDILSVADRALAAKNYQLALKYYQLAREFGNDFKTNWKIALVHYLSGNTGQALAACEALVPLARAKSQQKEQQQLFGLVLFEQSNYQQALNVFRELDDKEPLPAFLEQAACEYMLGNKEKAVALLKEGKLNNPKAFAGLAELEGTRYSSKLVQALKKINQD